MNVSLAELRRTMYQRADLDLVRLAPAHAPFFEAATRRAFESGDVAELYHENSKYVPGLMDRAIRSIHEFERPSMRTVETEIDRDYPGREYVDLPDPEPLDAGLGDVLAGRRSERRFGEETLSLEALSRLLYHAAGVTETREVDDDALGALTKSLRAYPSAGALYPVETYVVVLGCGDLEPGVYYYSTASHGLRVLQAGDRPPIGEALVSAGGTVDVQDADVVVVLSGAFPRSAAKYGPRGYRYLLQESGHVAQNVLLVATGLGLRSVPVGGFFDERLDELLGIDGTDESAVYCVVVGTAPGGRESS